MRVILSLIFIQILWSATYVAMKIAMVQMPIGLVMILRYGLATVGFFALGCFKRFPSFSPRRWAVIILIGISTFTLSPFCQLKGVSLSQVVDVSILVAMEPILTSFMAVIFLRERLTWGMIVVLVTSFVGVLILSGVSWEGWSGETYTMRRLVGNMIFLCALACEAIFSTMGRHLTQKDDPLVIVAWMHLFGFLTNLVVNFQTLAMTPLSTKATPSWIAVLFLGWGCSTIGYGVWYLLVKKNPVSFVAFSLFLQPIVGAGLGYLFFKEEVGVQTFLGTSFILIPLILWVVSQVKKQQVVEEPLQGIQRV